MLWYWNVDLVHAVMWWCGDVSQELKEMESKVKSNKEPPKYVIA